MMESIPVCGVAIRNDIVAPFDAPSFLNDMAVGITPHEHKGNGIPKMAAFSTERKLLPLKYLLYIVLGTNACIMPAKVKPSNR